MPSLPDNLLPSEDDLLYEEEILRNPFSLKLWWRYLQARADAPRKKRYLIYERAINALPGSYKLWRAYLKERKDAVRGLPLNHAAHTALNNTFERALVTMHKMPRIWLEYLGFLVSQKLLTRTRRTFDRALQSLPATQHSRVWELYLDFVKQPWIPVETALRVFRRFLKLEPGQIEDFIDFLVSAEKWQEAAEGLADVLNDEGFVSVRGKTKHQLWLELCDLLTRHATEIKGVKVDPIIRSGIKQFSHEVGRLWTSLADFYIRKGLFETARDVYEDGINTVMTVRDFSMIFDAYAQFEESMLAARMESLGEEELDAENGGGGNDGEEGWFFDDNDVDLRLARLELLMERRPELVSSVLLRQNPHNVHEWHKRVKLFKDKPERAILTYTEAVRTVDPFKAVGKPHTLWVAFAKLYEAHGDLTNARVVFEKAVLAKLKAVDDLAAVWCEWAEMELRHHNFNGARELLRRAVAEPPMAAVKEAAASGEESVQLRIHRSLRVWMLYVDVEESLGTLESTRSLYERILDLRIATPQIILNYALLLEESKYFEDAFKVYERGVNIFKYPHVREIWRTYLKRFVDRYGGKKLERARDLFEQALQTAPQKDCKELYLAYAKLEEEHGLARHALSVYERAAAAVEDSEKMGIYDLYIARAADLFGIAKTRDIYEKAIESGLPDADVKKMCLRYAALERKLGEIDRARAIFVHASQLADPRSDPSFWDTWNAFEIAHGNEDTFREMLRIKRSVSASYSQMHFIMPEYLMPKGAAPEKAEALAAAAAGEKTAGRLEDDMAALERQAAPAKPVEGRAPQFVSGGTQVQDDAATKEVVMERNPEEIELGEGDEEDEDEKVDIAQVEVPAGVFGELAGKAKELEKRSLEGEAQGEEPMGALERIKRMRKQ